MDLDFPFYLMVFEMVNLQYEFLLVKETAKLKWVYYSEFMLPMGSITNVLLTSFLHACYNNVTKKCTDDNCYKLPLLQKYDFSLQQLLDRILSGVKYVFIKCCSLVTNEEVWLSVAKRLRKGKNSITSYNFSSVICHVRLWDFELPNFQKTPKEKNFFSENIMSDTQYAVLTTLPKHFCSQHKIFFLKIGEKKQHQVFLLTCSPKRSPGLVDGSCDNSAKSFLLELRKSFSEGENKFYSRNVKQVIGWHFFSKSVLPTVFLNIYKSNFLLCWLSKLTVLHN